MIKFTPEVKIVTFKTKTTFETTSPKLSVNEFEKIQKSFYGKSLLLR